MAILFVKYMKLLQEMRQSALQVESVSPLELSKEFSIKNQGDYRTYTDQLRADGFIAEFTYALNDQVGHKLYSEILEKAKKGGQEYHETINNGNVILWIK